MRERNRRTGRAADAKHRHREPLRVRLARGRDGCVVGTIGEQDDVARVQAGLLNQFFGLLDRTGCAIARDRHRRRIQRVDEIAHGADVVGQRRGDERLAGVTDERGLIILAAFENVDELVTRALESARLFVLRHHRCAELEREHARRLIAIQRHRLAFPRGTGERTARHRPQDDREHDAGASGTRIDALDQMRQKMRIDHVAPRARVGASMATQEPERRHREQQQEPQRPQEMEVGERAHAFAFAVPASARMRQPGKRNANAAAASDAASGIQYNSSIGRRLCLVSATGSS